MVSMSLSSHSRNGAVAHTTTCALRRGCRGCHDEWAWCGTCKQLFVDLHFWARKREVNGWHWLPSLGYLLKS
ncbi:Short Transient Receptor Potential Channel 6 [Manis pentadactyla]|nr:Short Transient Receptor Potential Channel 6 [Manis pentadactyla]